MHVVRSLLAATLIATSCPAAAAPPPTWQGLVLVKSKKMDVVYLLPNADFRSYTQIMYDPVQIAFQKDWLQNYNDQAIGLSDRIDPGELRTAITQATKQFDNYFAAAFTKAGYPIASAPGPNVLRVSTAVLNVSVTAPDTGSSAGTTVAASAGQATFVVELRDSVSNQLLGQAIDPQIAGDYGGSIRTSASNWSDFDDVFKAWAQLSVAGLTKLKSLSPVDTNGIQKK